jgi:hypothetical protein
MPGLVVFRFDAPLIFANARTFRERDHRRSPTRRPRLRWTSSPPNRSPTSTRPRRICWRIWTRC